MSSDLVPPIGRLFFVSDRNHYFNIHYSREPRRASRVRGFWFIWALRPRLWRVSFCTANPKERRLKPSLFFQLGGFLTAGLQFFWNSEIEYLRDYPITGVWKGKSDHCPAYVAAAPPLFPLLVQAFHQLRCLPVPFGGGF